MPVTHRGPVTPDDVLSDLKAEGIDEDYLKDTAQNARFKDTIALGEHNGEGISTLNIQSVPDKLNPCIDWYYGRPLLYLYTIEAEEPVVIIALPTVDDPQMQLLSYPGYYDQEWFDNNRPSSADEAGETR